MRSVFFYTIGGAFAGGVFLRSFFDTDVAAIAFVLLLSFVLALVWHRHRLEYTSLVFVFSLALLCAALGILRVHVAETEPTLLAPSVGTEISITGIVVRDPDERGQTTHLYVREARTEELLLVTTDPYAPFSYGDRVSVTGVLERPESFETDLGRTFNYPGYLKARGVELTVSFADVTVESSGHGNPIIAILLHAKEELIAAIEGSIREPFAGLGEGLLLGERRALGDELEEAFRHTGIIHIVVLSGYNVMIVAEAIMRLLSAFFTPRVRVAIGVAAIAAFALIVGLSATVLRASVMAALVLVARATGREYTVTRALVFAGVVMVLFNPYLLAFDPGFQLSFLATLGLVLVAPHIEARLNLVPSAFQIREFITATLATQLMVLPLLVYTIGEFSVVSVLVNVLVLPAVPVAMFLTFAAGIAHMIFSMLGILTGFAAFVSLKYIIATATAFAALPFAAVAVPPLPFWSVVLGYGLIGAALYYLNRRPPVPAAAPNITPTHDLSDWTIVSEEEHRRTWAQTDSSPLR